MSTSYRCLELKGGLVLGLYFLSLFDKYLNLFIVVFIAVVKTVERVFVLSFNGR